MKKKQGYALGSLLLGAASWLCLLGLRHIERRMKKKEQKYRNASQVKLPARRFCLSLRSAFTLSGSYVVNGCGQRSWR